MKNLVMMTFFVLLSLPAAWAQGTFDLQENVPVEQNGLSYGYRIRNEKVKEVKDENYSRYEIEVYVTNNSGCPKVLLFRDINMGGSSMGVGSSPQTVAFFDCLNATGKRLTAKNQNVDARIFRLPHRIQETGADGKTITRYAEAEVGYGIRNGETVVANMIVIVPLGQRPSFTCRTAPFSTF